MGLFDALFGGGADLKLALDAKQVPEGGLLSGSATLKGGKKPLTLSALKVRLLYVSVKTIPGQTMPAIDTKILLDNTVAANQAIAPGSTATFPFTFQIPAGTLPSANGTSYTVQIQADIPGVKDPTDKAELKVVAGGNDGAANADTLYARWPALRGTEEQGVLDAVRDMRWKHSVYEPGKDLLVAEPLLARFMNEEKSSPDLRRAALETWAQVVEGRATRNHVKALENLAKRPGIEPELLGEVMEAAVKLAEAGGMELVHSFKRSEDRELRLRIARALHYSGGGDKLRLEILKALATDPDVGVRAAAYESFGYFDKEKTVMQFVAAHIAVEQSPEVLEACVKALRGGFYYKLGAITLQAYDQLSKLPHVNVRKAMANCLTSAASSETDVKPLVERLLADEDESVRKELAWELKNMREKGGIYGPLVQKVANSDPSEEVRGAAIGTLAELWPLSDVLPYYRQLLASNPPAPIQRGMVHGFKFRMERECKEILKQLMASSDPGVASEAKDGFEFQQ